MTYTKMDASAYLDNKSSFKVREGRTAADFP